MSKSFTRNFIYNDEITAKFECEHIQQLFLEKMTKSLSEKMKRRCLILVNTNVPFEDVPYLKKIVFTQNSRLNNNSSFDRILNVKWPEFDCLLKEKMY